MASTRAVYEGETSGVGFASGETAREGRKMMISSLNAMWMGNDNKMAQFMEEEALAFCDLLTEKVQGTRDGKVHVSV